MPPTFVEESNHPSILLGIPQDSIFRENALADAEGRRIDDMAGAASQHARRQLERHEGIAGERRFEERLEALFGKKA